jgi:hypothetical protein
MATTQHWDSASIDDKKHDTLHQEYLDGERGPQTDAFLVTPEDVSITHV